VRDPVTVALTQETGGAGNLREAERRLRVALRLCRAGRDHRRAQRAAADAAQPALECFVPAPASPAPANPLGLPSPSPTI
jgi:hypothetical protein